MMTSQNVMDAVVRFMVRQMAPCIRLDEISQKWVVANFNMKGQFSPLLCLVRNDMSNLRKIFGYEFLQSMENDFCYWMARKKFCLQKLAEAGKASDERDQDDPSNLQYWIDYSNCAVRDQSLSDIEKYEKFNGKLEDIGVSLPGIALVCLMDDAHKQWAGNMAGRLNDPDEDVIHPPIITIRESIEVVEHYFSRMTGKEPFGGPELNGYVYNSNPP